MTFDPDPDPSLLLSFVVNTILRAFMYLGFELVNPSLYNHDSSFVLVGYEL
jgi:hypothetical protein